MKILDPETLNKIKEQYDSLPYPQVPLEKTPRDDKSFDTLFIHNLVTSYYLRYQTVIDTSGKLLLDAGCGSGYKSLVLAIANPGAKVVGVDVSAASIDFAKTRLEHHGIDNAEFHVMRLEDLPSLGLTFDYINCDEVLYMVPNPVECLQAFKAVLGEEGIIRGNFHSELQRHNFYRSQALFKMMGLMDDNPDDLEVELVIEVMKSLKDSVDLKQKAWKPEMETLESKESILMNHMIQGDRGFTIPDVFSMLNASDLEFVSMLRWRHWEINDLFKDIDDLPPFLSMSLPEISIEDRLRFFELLHPVHRLIDFWCAHPQTTPAPPSPHEWNPNQWVKTRIHLHPQLQQPIVKEAVVETIEKRKSLDLRQYLLLPSKTPVTIDYLDAACLLPLWDNSRTLPELLARWLMLSPVDPLTLEPLSETKAFQNLQNLLIKLEAFLYILFEPLF